MRILVCAQRDLVVCVVLNHLLPALGDHTVTVALNRPAGVTPEPGDPLSRQRWFERDLADQVVFDPLDRLPRPAGELMTFRHLSRHYGVELHEVQTINDGDGQSLVRDARPDLVLSVRFDLLFREPVLSTPPLGILNVHPGRLPDHAGLVAPMHTLMSGQTNLTCTLHEVDRGIDTGAVIASADLAFDPHRSVFWHLPQLYVLGIDLFVEMLPGLAGGDRPTAQPQDFTRRRYHGRPSVEELQAFEDRGYRFLLESDFVEVVRRFGVEWQR